MTFTSDQVEPAMKTALYFCGIWSSERQRGIDLPNESTGFIPKDYTVGNYLTNALVSLITIHRCNWPSMRQTVANDGKRVSPSCRRRHL